MGNRVNERDIQSHRGNVHTISIINHVVIQHKTHEPQRMDQSYVMRLYITNRNPIVVNPLLTSNNDRTPSNPVMKALIIVATAAATVSAKPTDRCNMARRDV